MEHFVGELNGFQMLTHTDKRVKLEDYFVHAAALSQVSDGVRV